MNILDAIFTRRSIRKFKDIRISDENIKTILMAGMAAPSAHNKQPWRFIVIDNTVEGVRENIRLFSPFTTMINTSPLSILVCAEEGKDLLKDFWMLDCSACVENMLLAIHGLGLGAVWTGICPIERMMKSYSNYFNIPEGFKPHSLIILGEADEEKKGKNIYNEDFVFRGSWGEKF